MLSLGLCISVLVALTTVHAQNDTGVSSSSLSSPLTDPFILPEHSSEEYNIIDLRGSLNLITGNHAP
jgi:hypothetical protein